MKARKVPFLLLPKAGSMRVRMRKDPYTGKVLMKGATMRKDIYVTHDLDLDEEMDLFIRLPNT